MKGFRAALVVVALVCAVSSLAATSAMGRGHLDRSFGKNGVVDLRHSLKKYAGLGPMGVGPHGEVYFIEEDPVCFRGGCPQRVYLKRYRADGRLGGRILVGNLREYPDMAVDFAGRPVIAYQEHGAVQLRRYLPGGRPDPSFGRGGAASLRCGCHFDSLEATLSGRLLVIGSTELKNPKPFRGVSWYIARLRGDGSLDRSFAHAGVLRRPRPGFYDPWASASADGGALLYGFGCCRFPSAPFVQRLTPGGALPRGFQAAAKRSLHGLHGTRKEDIGWENVSVVEGRGGRVTVFGGDQGHTVVAGLRRNGERDPAVGGRGVRNLGFEVTDAAADGRGGSIFAAYLHGGGYKAGRITADGRFDRSFGWVELPGAFDEDGLVVASRGNGWAIVYSPGYSFCRQGCELEPSMYRVEW